MERNVGGMDRTSRLVVGPLLVIVGIVIFAGVITIEGTLGTVIAALAIIVGLVLAVTGYSRQCPINDATGRNTFTGR